MIAWFLSKNGILVVAIVIGMGALWDAGRRYEVRQEAARTEAANKRVGEVNASETTRDANEDIARNKALTDAKSVLERNKFLASPELAAVLSGIR